MSRHDNTPPMRVKLPADVDREDSLIGSFTARQIIILGGTALLLWTLWAATANTIPVAAFAAVAVPVGAAGFMLAVGRRDGISLDRWLLAAVRHRRSPSLLAPGMGDDNPQAPRWISTTGDSATRRVAPLKLPAKGVTADGLIDLGPDGTAALVRCSTVNFHLRSPGEQRALVGGFGRWLNSLDAPIQILVRARRVDLGGLAVRLEDTAAGLPDPQLEEAARYHAEFLRRLAAERELLHRDVTVIVRDTRTPAHTGHRAEAAARALAACEITATIADPDQAAAVLAECAGAPPPPPGQAAAAETVIRATSGSHR